MNRKSKIIVSVVGISIVLLALLGITYAYYLTRIEGNTNTNSISVTTADLKLEYGDGTGPNAGLITANDIMPGTDITKEFTVTNKGKSKVEGYLVVLENVNNTITRKQDVVYTLDCKLQDGTSCGSVTETIYPTNALSVIYTNDIDINVIHNYTLIVHYKNLEDVDQSEDMGKEFSGRINIMDGNTNPYKTGVTSTDNASLVYNIINNAMTNKNGTIYSPTPLTTPAEEVSGEEERTLSLTQDNLGTSYYFRGNVQDNYVLFNNMCFRIVRIEGDGSIKLIFAGDISTGAINCNEVGETTGLIKEDDTIKNVIYGYRNVDSEVFGNYENFQLNKISLKKLIDNWYIEKFTTDIIKEKIKTDKWCLGKNNYKYDTDGNVLTDLDLENQYQETGKNSYRYSAGKRLWTNKTTDITCNGEDYVIDKYGALTVDEVILSGATTAAHKTNYYLYENAKDNYWWLLSYANFSSNYDVIFCMSEYGGLSGCGVVGERGVRPSITLVPNTSILGGDGTKLNPYIIN